MFGNDVLFCQKYFRGISRNSHEAQSSSQRDERDETEEDFNRVCVWAASRPSSGTVTCMHAYPVNQPSITHMCEDEKMRGG